jgi:hypothetical protein
VAIESRQSREGAEDGEATALQVTGAEDPYATIRSLPTSTSPEELRKGLELAKHEITRVGSCEAKPLFEIVSVIFYIDPVGVQGDCPTFWRAQSSSSDSPRRSAGGRGAAPRRGAAVFGRSAAPHK